MAKTRPLSPHLQIYKLPLPAVMSITHRISGVVLSSGTVLLAFWLMMLGSGEAGFATAQMILSHPAGMLVLAGYSAALFYHGCNGVRHLFWDMGKGLTIEAVYRSGRLTIGLAVVLIVLFWLYQLSAIIW
jgi:succinate dehydrogenase / fumarate reductase cytochrome b subunit